MSIRKHLEKLVCLFTMIAVVSFFHISLVIGGDVYDSCDLGVSVTATSSEQDAFLGNTLKWDKIITKVTGSPPASNEYKPGNWSPTINKIKVEHRYSSNDEFQIKPTPTEDAPSGVVYVLSTHGDEIHLSQIEFTPEKTGYTRETYRIFVVVPKLLKSNSQHAKDSNGNLLWWRDYADITVTYAVPEFKVVAVKFTSEHELLRPNVNNTSPAKYDIGNAQTYSATYPDGTLQYAWSRNANGQIVLPSTVNKPITHTWGKANPAVPIQFTVKLKNFGGTIKSKIYFGGAKPNNPNPYRVAPTEGNTAVYSFSGANNYGTICVGVITQQIVIRNELNNVVDSTTISQNVYWTFGTPQIAINEARMDLTVNNVFVDQGKTNTKSILEDMLNKPGVVNYGEKCIRDEIVGELVNWNRLNEGQVDCISHSEFFQKIIKASGLPVNTGVKTYIATYALNSEPKRPESPIEGSFNWDMNNFNGLLSWDPNFPQGGGLQSVDASVFTAINNKLSLLGQNHYANLIFYNGMSPNNFEAVIIMRDTKSNAIFYNPGGCPDLYSENERKKVITESMTALEWEFWRTTTTTNPITGATSVERMRVNDRIVDYIY